MAAPLKGFTYDPGSPGWDSEGTTTGFAPESWRNDATGVRYSTDPSLDTAAWSTAPNPVDTSKYQYAGEISRGDRGQSAAANLTNQYIYAGGDSEAGFHQWLNTGDGQSAIAEANKVFGPNHLTLDMSANGADWGS